MPSAPPTPSFSFTIPSIHDDIDLDCRIYNPPQAEFFPTKNETTWTPRGAVVAHPYAPLGGCYDDPIVTIAVEECLKKGLVVGTFNFRGAPGSKSSTSWTTKPEVNDYISVVGMLVHYLQTLSASLSPHSTPPPEDDHLTPVPSNNLAPPPSSPNPSPLPPSPKPIHLLLSGYSYGSLITTLLPPTTTLLHSFYPSTPPTSTPSEILARAHNLALQTFKDLNTSPRGRPIAIGGEEAPPGTRPSREASRKSLDAIRHSVEQTRHSFDRSRRRLLSRNNGSRRGSSNTSTADEKGSEADDRQNRPLTPPPSPPSGLQPNPPVILTRYLLISPLLGPVAGLATLSPSTLFRALAPHAHPPPLTSAQNLLRNPTFVIYGTNDTFTSAKRLRKWCAALQMQGEGDGFASREVEGAGHFWREEGVERVLREGVGGWLSRSEGEG